MKAKIHFSGLNTLRLFAAVIVLVVHTDQFLELFGYINVLGPFINPHTGKLAVGFFFVLSGFLITYLLLEEKSRLGFIDIKAFYVRRALRVWPLYYLIVFLAFIILPLIDWLPSNLFGAEWLNQKGLLALLFILIMPNVANTFPLVPYAAHLWSIGVEEQFYLTWPLLTRLKLNIAALLLLVIVTYTIVLFLLKFLHFTRFASIFLERLYHVWSWFRIDAMAIGGLAAYLLENKNTRILVLIYSKWAQIATYLSLTFLYIANPSFEQAVFPTYFLLYSVLILNIATNPLSLLRLNNRHTENLGKISYGLYMYHPIAIAIALVTLENIASAYMNDGLFQLLATLISLAITITLATLSYIYFEKPFLRMKRKFSRVANG